jgi:hypothetical protein
MADAKKAREKCAKRFFSAAVLPPNKSAIK